MGASDLCYQSGGMLNSTQSINNPTNTLFILSLFNYVIIPVVIHISVILQCPVIISESVNTTCLTLGLDPLIKWMWIKSDYVDS